MQSDLRGRAKPIAAAARTLLLYDLQLCAQNGAHRLSVLAAPNKRQTWCSKLEGTANEKFGRLLCAVRAALLRAPLASRALICNRAFGAHKSRETTPTQRHAKVSPKQLCGPTWTANKRVCVCVCVLANLRVSPCKTVNSLIKL